MTYTQLAVVGVAVMVLIDLYVARTRLVTRKGFWVTYAIIVFFQLLTNGVLTGLSIVTYSGDAIVGSSTPMDGPPAFIGDGRLMFAPVEDLLFGFSLILLSIMMWVVLGRRGIQRDPMAGPPRWRDRKARSQAGPAT